MRSQRMEKEMVMLRAPCVPCEMVHHTHRLVFRKCGTLKESMRTHDVFVPAALQNGSKNIWVNIFLPKMSLCRVINKINSLYRAVDWIKKKKLKSLCWYLLRKILVFKPPEWDLEMSVFLTDWFFFFSWKKLLPAGIYKVCWAKWGRGCSYL